MTLAEVKHRFGCGGEGGDICWCGAAWRDDPTRCEICGEPLPEGEIRFRHHGYSGDCPISLAHRTGCWDGLIDHGPSPGFERWMNRALDEQARWREWFAWFPVRLMGGERAWFEVVERRVPSYWDAYLEGWRPVGETRVEYRRPIR